MLCCNCQENQATKAYTHEVGGVEKTEYYCLRCYHQLFLTVDMPLLETVGNASECLSCGRTLKEFFASGIVGCEDCYKAMQKEIMPVIILMQGDKTHCGRKAVLSADREKLILERNDTKERVEACMAKQDFMGAKIYSEKLKKLNRILYNSEDFE